MEASHGFSSFQESGDKGKSLSGGEVSLLVVGICSGRVSATF
jgi:hypothetical protein